MEAPLWRSAGMTVRVRAVTCCVAATAGVSANRARAVQDAHALLARIVLPVGAVRLAGAPAGATVIANRFPSVATPALTDVYGYWRVPGPPRTVLAFIGAHTPHPTTGLPGGGSSRSGPSWWSLGLVYPSVPGVLDARSLVIKVVGLRDGTTAVRVDAEVVWVIPRPASERIPANVREIDVTSGPPRRPPEVSVKVTAPVTITKIVSLINSLPTVQPSTLPCPTFPADTPVVTLTFHATPHGRIVAQATQLAWPTVTTACDPMNLTLYGRRQTPLLLDGGAAIRTIQRLLGVTLALAH